MVRAAPSVLAIETGSVASGMPLFAGRVSAAERLLQFAAAFQFPLPTLFRQNRVAAEATVACSSNRTAASAVGANHDPRALCKKERSFIGGFLAPQIQLYVAASEASAELESYPNCPKIG